MLKACGIDPRWDDGLTNQGIDMNDELKDILIAAATVVLMRHGDVSTEDGSYATVDIDSLLRLDYALAEYFELDSDDVTFENIDDLIAKIGALKLTNNSDGE